MISWQEDAVAERGAAGQRVDQGGAAKGEAIRGGPTPTSPAKDWLAEGRTLTEGKMAGCRGGR